MINLKRGKFVFAFFFLFYNAYVLNAQQPELVMPIGHTDYINSAQFSPDGKYIVIAGDNTVKVWDVQTGALVHTLVGHRRVVYSAQYSPDGKYIVTASSDSTAKVWDAQKWTLLHSLEGHKDRLIAAEYSSDGKYIVTTTSHHKLKTWNAQKGTLVHALKKEIKNLNFTGYSPDRKYFVGTFMDTARVWDAQTWVIVHTLQGHTRGVLSAQYSPDGKYIVTASWDNTSRVWDAQNGALLHTLEGHISWVKSAQYSPDGKYIITASDDKTAKVWDAHKGTLLHTLGGDTDRVEFAQFSPDGKYIVTAGDNTAKVWDTQTWVIVHTLQGHTDKVNSAQLSSDGKYIVIAWDNTAKVWDVQKGAFVYTLEGHTDWVKSAQYSPDGKYIVTATGNYTAKLYDAQTGALLHTLERDNKYLKSPGYSPNGKYIVTAWDSTAKVRDAQTCALVHTLEGHTDWVNSAKYSPSGKYIVTTSMDNTAKVWDAQTGVLVHTLVGHTNKITSAQYSPNEKYIVTTSMDTAKVWDAQTGALVHTLLGHTNEITSAQYSPDGKYIITASWDKTVKVWDAQTGTCKQTIALEQKTYFEDFQNGILLNYNYSEVKLFNLNSRKYLYSFIAVDSTDYLVCDSLGRYDGTELARKLMYFVCGDEVIGLDQTKDALWIPNLAERIMNGDKINAPTLASLDLCGSIPLVETVTDLNGYRFNITPRKGGLGESILYVNNIEIKRYKPSELIKAKTGYQLYVSKSELAPYFIAGQDNPVVVKSYTAKNDVISRGAEVVEDKKDLPKEAPNLYAVIVGVSDYKGNGMDLKYAAKDAKDISKVISGAAKKLLNSGDTNRVFVYTIDTDPGYTDFPDKTTIRNTIDSIGKKAQAKDILLVFFAGHGIVGDSTKTFYFMTADASRNSDIPKTGISMKELTDWINPKNIKAQKRILIFDACQSGQAINNMVTISGDFIASRDDENATRIKTIEALNRQAGMYILSASTSKQSAYEANKYSQGVLTYSLLKTIKEKPEILTDSKYLNVTNWFNTSVKMVEDLNNDLGNPPQQPQLVTTSNFNIGEIDKDVLATIKLASEKPIFVTSNFRNNLTKGDDKRIANQVDIALSDLSNDFSKGWLVFNYNPKSKTENAYSIAGDYEVKGNDITVEVYLLQNNTPVPNANFTVAGKVSELTQLINSILDKIKGYVIKP